MRLPAVFLILFAGASIPVAESRASEPTFYFVCNAPAAHYSMWRRSVTSRTVSLKGTVQVPEARDDPKYVPVFSLFVQGDSETRRAGFKVRRSRSNAELWQVGLINPQDKAQLVVIGTLPKPTGALPFTLNIEPDRLVTLTIGGVSGSFQVRDFPIQQLEVSCSTGAFEFRDLKITELE